MVLQILLNMSTCCRCASSVHTVRTLVAHSIFNNFQSFEGLYVARKYELIMKMYTNALPESTVQCFFKKVKQLFRLCSAITGYAYIIKRYNTLRLNSISHVVLDFHYHRTEMLCIALFDSQSVIISSARFNEDKTMYLFFCVRYDK